MRVLLTGSSSCLARALLPQLCSHPAVSSVTGIDWQRPVYTHPRFQAIEADLRTLVPETWLAKHDALIHLAWVVLRGKTPLTTMRDINLAVSQHWFDAASGMVPALARIIHVSSASVYGHGMMLNEAAPLRPIAGFQYAQHKAELEHWLDAHHPDIVRLRPHIILGTHAQPLLKQILQAPFYPHLPQPLPQLQCVHEDDVARAIAAALTLPVQGAFNLAAPHPFSLHDAIRSQHPHALPLPTTWIQVMLQGLWHINGFGGEPGWFDGVKHSLTLDCGKAEQQLGWRATISPQQMFDALRAR